MLLEDVLRTLKQKSKYVGRIFINASKLQYKKLKILKTTIQPQRIDQMSATLVKWTSFYCAFDGHPY